MLINFKLNFFQIELLSLVHFGLYDRHTERHCVFNGRYSDKVLNMNKNKIA